MVYVSFQVLCVALVVVMAKPQEKVQVVDPGYYQGGNTNGVNVVDNPDPGFYQGGNNNGVGVIDNPDPGFYQGGNNGVHVVDGPQGGNNGVIVVDNPDPGYYQGGSNGGNKNWFNFNPDRIIIIFYVCGP
uniref:Uncharacterized protein n=2 Tax=Pectinophora gossypiella TaxID=13191 RepID=A0A1E1WC42_PECGO